MPTVPELPPGLRAFCLIGKYGSTFLPVAVDENGQLYILVQGVAEVAIPEGVEVTQADSVREVQGSDGETTRTVAVDTSGQIIMVPRGQSGNYMAVDTSGRLSAQICGYGPLAVLGDALFSNISFETAGAGGADVFADWSENAGDGSVDDETGVVRSGAHAAKLTQGASNNTYLYQQATVEAGREAVLVLYAAGDGTRGGRYAIYDVTNSEYIVGYTETGVTDKAFTRLAVAFTIPATCTTVRVTVRSPSSEGGLAYFDDVSIYYAVEAGAAAGETLPLATDALGQMIAVFRGREGNYVAVDGDGNIAAAIRGDKGGGTLETVAVDASGQLVMVPRGQSGYYMLVDEDGYLAAKFKAMFAGSPYDVACDATGRLKFFLTDNVDQWGEYLEVGNAELAARLYGCPVSYDRRGQVLYRTDFETGLGAWTLSAGGAGSTGLQASGGIQGENCVWLHTTAADVDTAYMAMFYPLPVGALPLGFGLYFSGSGLPEFWRLRIRVFDGTSYWVAYVKGLAADGKLYVYDDGASETEVGSWYTGAAFNSLWHYVKLVFSTADQYYVRLIYDGEEIDLSAVKCYKSSSNIYECEVGFGIDGRAANEATWLVDCPCFTTRES